MPEKAKKRDGRVVDFDIQKIEQAILNAMQAVREGDEQKATEIASNVFNSIEEKYDSKDEIANVEEIQDIVEKELIFAQLASTAKAYILYRDLHSRQRNINNLLDIGDHINTYLSKSDWTVHSNTSVDFHLQGMYKNLTEKISEMYWMNEVYNEEMRDLHFNKDLHIHKSSSISSYCVGWDIQDILLVGFTGVAGNVTSAPAKHLGSALGQIVNFMYTLTNEAPDGAVALSSLDTYLAPFIRNDGLNQKQVKQALQEFIYNMNVPTKSGGQVVFSNITLDLKIPKHMKEEAIIIGGEYQKETYGDYQKELDMFNKALVEVYTEGDSKGTAFMWPIPTYNIDKNFDWDNPVYDGLWKMTAKYGIPYFANFVNSDMDPEDVRSMCCRLRIDNKELQRRGGGFFGANPLTGSIGYTTINLPRLGYLYSIKKSDGKSFTKAKKAFLDRLEYLVNMSAEILNLRRELIEDLTERGMYPYSKFYLRKVKERSGQYWSNHFNTVGILGMNEAILNFMGKDITTKEGQKFALEVMDFLNEKVLAIQERDDILYNIEASPAEGASYAIAKKDKELYPDIIVANEAEYKEGAEPYYTNSTHLPVGFTDDIFEALDLQDDLQAKYTGGTVFHGFLGQKIDTGEEVKQLVKKIAEGYKLPYFTLTPTFSICQTHNYISGEHFECPKCGEDCQVYSRVVGKIAPISRWNLGKKQEFKDRLEYDDKISMGQGAK
jgi:ribonucleoside-triphosphate reductase (formate)